MNRVENFLIKSKAKFGDKYSFPYIEREYKTNKSTVTIKCNVCGNVFTKRPNDLLSAKTDTVCRNCRKNCYIQEHGITYDELKRKAESYDIEPYDGKRSRTQGYAYIKCKRHGLYKSLISSILKGECECKKCIIINEGKKRTLPIENVISRIKEKYNNEVTPYEETYVNASTDMKFKCNKCGKDFFRNPNNFMFGKMKFACPYCSKKERSKEKTKTQKEFIHDVISLYGENAFSFEKTKYTKSSDKVTLTCKKCGKDFEIEANSLLQGHGCPRHNRNVSFIEHDVANYIKGLGFEIVENDRSIGIELDVLVVDKMIAFEIDGVFWHSEFYKSNDYHIKKTIECEKNGIRLIHLYEDELIYNNDICKSMITNILGKTPNKIYARECEVKEVSSSEASSFLYENHIQGKCGSKYKYGLYYDGELVSLMTFGSTRHFIGSSSHQYELLRFCNKKFYNVVGGASKLFSHFIKDMKPNSIVSYADRRWSVGDLYYKLGFKLYNLSKPNYYYVIKNKRMNRFNFRKSILVKKYGCPTNMSEREFCLKNRWLRIYDCGCMCFEWKQNINQ